MKSGVLWSWLLVLSLSNFSPAWGQKPTPQDAEAVSQIYKSKLFSLESRYGRYWESAFGQMNRSYPIGGVTALADAQKVPSKK